MNEKDIIIEFRISDENGCDTKSSRTIPFGNTDSGVDIYLMYEEFINFLRLVGFHDTTISKIQYIEERE